jgi:hypothetical protein
MSERKKFFVLLVLLFLSLTLFVVVTGKVNTNFINSLS